MKLPAFETETECDASIPEENDDDVPEPDVNVPVDVISAVPEKTLGPLVHALLFASLAVILTLNEIPVTWAAIFPPPTFSTRKFEIEPAFIVKEELAGPEVVPSVTDIVVVSDFFNVVFNVVDETPLAKLTLVV